MSFIGVFVCLVTVSVCYGAEDDEWGGAKEHDTRKSLGSHHHSAKETYRLKRYCAKPKEHKPEKPHDKGSQHILHIIKEASTDLTSS